MPAAFQDRHISAVELREILATRDHPRRLALLATLMRESRPDEVWRWVDPADIAADEGDEPEPLD